MAFTVGELSRLTGVTVRTLHHYDGIGLVRPSQRTAAGYRIYDEDDVLRLQNVLVLRELGVPLAEITAMIDGAPARDQRLRQHRETLIAKRARIDAMLASLDATIVTLEKGTTMQPEDVKSMFDGFDPAEHADEAQQRWGETDAFQVSARRTKQYGKPEWDQIKHEADAIYTRLAALMASGAAPADPEVQVSVAAHRAHLDRWFYPCSKPMHKGLGEMYVADPRFAANLDKVAAGLAQFLRDAIAAS